MRFLKSILRRMIKQPLIKTLQYFRFIKQFHLFRKLSLSDNSISWKDRYPCLGDDTSITTFDTHYVYHPAFAARVLRKTNPEFHVDIGSTLHFCSMVSAFVPVKFYDYRPANLNLNNLESKKADILNLPFSDSSLKSLSCMHVVEHIGLGRYGDPLDFEGDVKAIRELIRVLAVSGNLLFVVPVGKPVLRFNGHRIYSYEKISELFSTLKIRQFSLVDDAGNYHENADPCLVKNQIYGCGCWWFEK